MVVPCMAVPIAEILIWRTVKYFNYSYLRKSFQTVLLNKLEKRIGPSFRKTKSELYRKDKNGFLCLRKAQPLRPKLHCQVCQPIPLPPSHCPFQD